MDFPTALRNVINGGKITKSEWENPEICLFIKDEILKIQLENGTIVPLLVSEADLLGTDWIIKPGTDAIVPEVIQPPRFARSPSMPPKISETVVVAPLPVIPPPEIPPPEEVRNPTDLVIIPEEPLE